MLNSLSEVKSTFSAECAFRVWYNLIEDYSRRRLTYDADKLLAVAGIAKKISGIAPVGRDGELGYLSGLWKKDLIRGLLCRSSNSHSRENVSGVYLSPSWAWPSHFGGVTWRHSSYVDACKVIDAEVKTDGADPLSRPTDGFLKLQGTLIEIAPPPIRNSRLEQLSHRADDFGPYSEGCAMPS